MNEQEALQLLERFSNDQCTEEERAIVILWLEERLVSHAWSMVPDERVRLGKEIKQGIDAHIDHKTASKSSGLLRRFGTLRRMSAAAAILLLMTGAAYLIVSRSARPSISGSEVIVPGGNKAMLVLADGSRIPLTGAKDGELAAQGATRVIKSKDGLLVYLPQQDGAADTTSYNTITTPRGGQYQVQLSDGSRIWLNAASSITFPTHFSRTRRPVSITGEAYFEVAPDSHRPFTVTSPGQTVQVLGTRFDIKSYPDEQYIWTTLIEGSVRVGGNGQAVTMRPGEAALSDKNGGTPGVRPADGDKEIAWTRGEFVFRNDNIESIMRQISRWYDVDVAYEGATAGKDFSGSVSRFSDVGKVLNTLQLTGIIHFKIQGRRIMVITK